MFKNNKGKIRILFISHGATNYGADTSLYLLIKYLNKEIFYPVVILPENGPLQDKLQTIGVPIHISPLRQWIGVDDSAGGFLQWLADLPERVQRIIEVVYQLDIKIIHSNVPMIFEGALAAKLTGKPHIYTVRGNLFAHTWVNSFMPVPSAFEILSTLSHAIVAVSNGVKDSLRPHVDKTKLRIIHNGIETQSFQAQYIGDSPYSSLHQTVNPKKARVCSIGRVAIEKRYDLLIDAAAMVVKDYPGVRFSVFGLIQDKLLYQRLLQQYKKLNLTKNILFEGHTDRVQEHLQETDLVVLSSETEGFPRVLLEAMLAGKPIVSTRCEGAEDAIIDGKTGYLVPLNDPGALAEAILKVLDNPEHARKMGLLGQERVLKHFDAQHTTKQYEALYQEVLEGDTTQQTQDKDGEAVLFCILSEMLDRYGESLREMDARLRHLQWFEEKVKRTWAYRLYRIGKALRLTGSR